MCYTYVSKTSSPKDFEILKKPINDLIYLCGEHLCFDFIGTVHGAYISGIEAASSFISQNVDNLFNPIIKNIAQTSTDIVAIFDNIIKGGAMKKKLTIKEIKMELKTF